MHFINAIVNVKKNFSKTSKINIQLIVYLREEDQLLKFRNKFVSKRIGTKTLASLLAFGMALGSPMAVFADDGETAVVAENTVQAKKTDGSEVFVSVSDYVRGMLESGAVRLNDETGYLEDTSTGQKVDPETGERLTETPDVPETPAIPDTPGNQENPETPGTPENPENPEAPENPDTDSAAWHRRLLQVPHIEILSKESPSPFRRRFFAGGITVQISPVPSNIFNPKYDSRSHHPPFPSFSHYT